MTFAECNRRGSWRQCLSPLFRRPPGLLLTNRNGRCRGGRSPRGSTFYHHGGVPERNAHMPRRASSIMFFSQITSARRDFRRVVPTNQIGSGRKERKRAYLGGFRPGESPRARRGETAGISESLLRNVVSEAARRIAPAGRFRSESVSLGYAHWRRRESNPVTLPVLTRTYNALLRKRRETRPQTGTERPSGSLPRSSPR